MIDVTFIVKTFLRPHCAHRLIDSIFAKYPAARVLVADDSPVPLSRANVTVFHLPFDSGSSYGRNYLVDRVETPYFVLCDDDVIITDQTNIERMLEPLRMDAFDIVSACLMNGDARFVWEGVFDLQDGVLVFRPGNRGEVDGIVRYDMCHNFFVGHTAKIRALRWDDDLKINNHTDFFLRALGRIRVGVDLRSSVGHLHESTSEYAQFRGRGKKFRALFMRKHGLKAYRNEVLRQETWKRMWRWVRTSALVLALAGVILAIARSM